MIAKLMQTKETAQIENVVNYTIIFCNNDFYQYFD